MFTNQSLAPDSQHIINQIEGFYGVFGKDSKCLMLNKTAANWLGYKSPDHGIGCYYEDIQAPAVESATFFRTIDAMVLKQNTRIFYLGYYGYNDSYRVIQGIKSPFLDEHNETVGISCQFNDVSKLNIVNKDHLLFQPDYISSDNHKNKQFCYLFQEKNQNSLLTEREDECLFFLLRRKTAKDISKILSLSHRTIEDHIENIRTKLKCSSKSELIEKATLEHFGNQLPIKYLEKLWKK